MMIIMIYLLMANSVGPEIYSDTFKQRIEVHKLKQLQQLKLKQCSQTFTVG
jgi:hypothetical protein